MSRILQKLREQNPFKRVFARLFPSSVVHPHIRLSIFFLASHIPLVLALVAGIHAEEHIHDKDSILTRCSPAAEAAWLFLTAMCGLLATVMNLYCVDQLMSTSEQRRKRNWPKWSRRVDRIYESSNPTCSTSCSGTTMARGETFELVDISPQAGLSPTATQTEGASASHGNIDAESIRLVYSDSSIHSDSSATASRTSLSTNSDPLSPADGFSPNMLVPQHPGGPPTYHEAVIVSTDRPQPIAVDMEEAINTRPTIRIETPDTIPRRIQPLTSEGGPPSWSMKSKTLKIVWKFCRSGLFVFSIAPLVLSCCIQLLVRDSIYSHACDGYEWEVRLDAKNGLAKPSTSASLPTASFIDRATPSPRSFMMEMSLESTPRAHAAEAKFAGARKHHLDVAWTKSVPQRKGCTHYDRFFHLSCYHASFAHQLLLFVSYDTFLRTYRGIYVSPPSSSRPSLSLAGRYTSEHMMFPEMGLRQVGGGVEDYFGFPRVVLEKDGGEAVTSRVKRRSCGEVKVCFKGIDIAEAVVAVGTLLLSVVEAASECGGR